MVDVFDRERAWLAALKVGDLVGYRYGHFADWRTAIVDRLTPTQIVLDNKARFRRETGRAVGGDSWLNRGAITELTQDIQRGMWRKASERRLRDIHWQSESDAVITAVIEALDEHAKVGAVDPHAEVSNG